MRWIAGHKASMVARQWKILHNEELYAQYSSPSILLNDQIKKTQIGRVCSTYGGKERCRQGFGGKT
jgi:hypothetical protein